MNKIYLHAMIESGNPSKCIYFDEIAYLRALYQFAGKRVRITIEPESNPRTLSQNAYLWGVVYKLIADHTGHTVEEIHEFCKLNFNQKPLEKVHKILNNNWHALNYKLLIGQSTTELDTKGFADYIDKIAVFAASELGIDIPKPGEVAG